MIKQATVPLMQNANSSPSRRVGFHQRGIISLPPVMIHISIPLAYTHPQQMTRASLRPVCKTTTLSRNLNKKEGVHGLTPFIHQFWARYQAYLQGTDTQSVAVICKGMWGNPEEHTAFLYRLWAQHQLSKKWGTTRTAPF
jgi:hypothetical protein